MKRIYLDNAATTAVDPKVVEAMNKSHQFFGNPSSLHSFGQEARKLVDQSRDVVAEFLNCKPTEVIFTSGGSESDNLAIRGMIQACHSREDENPEKNYLGSMDHAPDKSGLPEDDNRILPHVITSAIEHHAVLHTVEDLEKEGKIEATYIKPNHEGIIQIEDVKKAIKDNTVLVSIMYVNNEVGTVQPIREIGKMIEKENKGRSNKIYFHTDAVQAAEFFNMDTKYLHVDLLTLTAHKFHGPKGIGVLFIKKGTPVEPQIVGGEHEFRLRAGTENTASIAGLAAAIEEIRNPKHEIRNKSEIINSKNQNITDCHSEFISESVEIPKQVRDDNFIRIKKLRNKLEGWILKNIPDTYLNGDKEQRNPAILNISFKNAEGEAIILNLDFLGIAVSSGSACTARSLEPSHVLMAMGIPRVLSHGAIRFSLSRETTEGDINRVIEVLPGIIKKLREMSPFK